MRFEGLVQKHISSLHSMPNRIPSLPIQDCGRVAGKTYQEFANHQIEESMLEGA